MLHWSQRTFEGYNKSFIDRTASVFEKKSSRVPTPRELSRLLDVINTCVGNKHGRQTFRKHDF